MTTSLAPIEGDAGMQWVLLVILSTLVLFTIGLGAAGYAQESIAPVQATPNVDIYCRPCNPNF